MKNFYRRGRWMLSFSFLFCLSSLLMAIAFAWSRPIDHVKANKPELRPGEKVPLIPLFDTLTKEERQYLGMPINFFDFFNPFNFSTFTNLNSANAFNKSTKNKSFFLKDINADYIILEFLNRYCVSCMIQAPILNDLYYRILNDSQMKDRVKILAIGVGNNQREIQEFHKEKDIPFPVIPDPEFEAYETIGDPGGTPFLLIVRRTPDGELLAESRLGLIGDEEIFIYKLKELLSLDVASFKKKVRERTAFETKRLDPKISLSEEEIQEKILHSISQGKNLAELSLQKEEFQDHGLVYIIESESTKNKGGTNQWFAKLYTRSPICDLCHPVYFLLIFNQHGIITDFIPIYITKYGNTPFNEGDTRKLTEKIVGKDLNHRFRFQPEYDSVTGATISVSLIFNTLNKANQLYYYLQQKGYASKQQSYRSPDK